MKFILNITSVSEFNHLVTDQGRHQECFGGRDIYFLNLVRPEWILIQKNSQIPDLPVQARCPVLIQIFHEDNR